MKHIPPKAGPEAHSRHTRGVGLAQLSPTDRLRLALCAGAGLLEDDDLAGLRLPARSARSPPPLAACEALGPLPEEPAARPGAGGEAGSATTDAPAPAPRAAAPAGEPADKAAGAAGQLGCAAPAPKRSAQSPVEAGPSACEGSVRGPDEQSVAAAAATEAAAGSPGLQDPAQEPPSEPVLAESPSHLRASAARGAASQGAAPGGGAAVARSAGRPAAAGSPDFGALRAGAAAAAASAEAAAARSPARAPAQAPRARAPPMRESMALFLQARGALTLPHVLACMRPACVHVRPGGLTCCWRAAAGGRCGGRKRLCSRRGPGDQ